ncbi:hypothetical protein Mgra_00004760 [Meloidogyne graminicola]|uniref:C2H2-type domain-containing protein n=1 Tax=Meloidogyne graminicola TaxID=189291 RepID=A0A8S9ZR12_9BILA|nr:hypothetical protein Mgra_00004760 [Meloidogyne graminicola]
MIDEINQYVKSIVVHKDVGEAKIFLQERANVMGKDRYLNTSSTSRQNGTDTASRSAKRSKRVYGFMCDFESCSERFASIAKLSIHKKVKHGMLNRDIN